MSAARSTRKQVQFGGHYHDRIPLEDDFEVVQVRTAALTLRNNAYNTETTCLPLQWTIGSSWAPDESAEYSLNPDDEWFDEVLEANVEDIMHQVVTPKAKRKCSQISVCFYICATLLTLTLFADQTSRLLEGECAR